ncbi:hypothetical protein NRS6110_04284 [Bacillus subtilis]|nr:hypothetical protein NRS6110_04284 [Bacillus subtilis]
MAKRVSCPLPLVSRIFRKAQPVRQGRMPGIRWRTWPSASVVPCRWYPGSSGRRIRSTRTRCQDKVADMAKRVSCPLPLVSRIFRKAQPVRQGRMPGIRWRTWPSASVVPCRWYPGSSGRRIRSTRTRCQDKVADMAKRVSCPLPLVSRIFRKAHPEHQDKMPG